MKLDLSLFFIGLIGGTILMTWAGIIKSLPFVIFGMVWLVQSIIFLATRER